MKYIKSCLNYTGGKYKLLNQIMPKIPKSHMFIDLFGGGFNVGINAQADIVVYNDINKPLVDLLKTFYEVDAKGLLDTIDGVIKEYGLNKTNQDGFLCLRENYNNGKYIGADKNIVLYVLIAHSFNNQIRFNSKGEFNMPFGKDRSEFNPTLRQKFIEFKETMDSKDMVFFNKPFNAIKMDKLSENTFVYVDPPYFNSTATYNENGGWTENDERNLLALLDSLTERKIKWALSNNLKCENHIIDEWIKDKKVYELNHSYSNCNYQKKDKSKDREILVTNY